MKNIVTKILTRKKATMPEINEFIVGYVESETGKVPTAQQITGILQMLQDGLFNFVFAANKYAATLGLTVLRVQDIKTGQILKTVVYE